MYELEEAELAPASSSIPSCDGFPITVGGLEDEVHHLLLLYKSFILTTSVMVLPCDTIVTNHRSVF
jgi:hypothetical protein